MIRLLKKLACALGWHEWVNVKQRCYCNDHLIDSLKYVMGYSTACCSDTDGNHWVLKCKRCGRVKR